VNILRKTDVDFFAVSSIYEAIHIAPMTKGQSIFILEAINEIQPFEQIFLCAKRGFHCSISSLEGVDHVCRSLEGSKHVLNLPVKVVTGMGRCGLESGYSERMLQKIDECDGVRLAGVYTHFATADEEDLSYAYEQLGFFKDFLSRNGLDDREDVLIHAANSAATIKMPGSHFDMVRCGISMYGYYSRPMKDAPVELKPVVKLLAPIVRLKSIPAGQSVSYGCSFVTKRDTVVAIVPLGYADGYWRCFSNSAKMKVGQKLVEVIGRVCMDQLLVDVTDVGDVELGQMVTVIDNIQDSPCGAYALADIAGTICYEILICIHAHVTRIVH
jgi:alanine racemase